MLTEDRVKEIIHEEVIKIVRGHIPELFGTINSAMMAYFDDRYVALAETATAAATATGGGGASRGFQYRDFDNTKPSNFDGV